MVTARENFKRKTKSGIEEIKNPITTGFKGVVQTTKDFRKVGRKIKSGIKELRNPISPEGKKVRKARRKAVTVSKAIKKTLGAAGVKSIKQGRKKLQQLKRRKVKRSK